MTNNIDVNVINNDYSCSVELLNRDNNKSVNFSLTNPALLNKSIKLEQNILKAHNLEDKAVIETTTYTNHVYLDVQAENMTLVSEEINRVAILSNGEPVSMVTAIKVVDENNKELRYSLQPQEHSVEIHIEEEMTKALVIIECAPYVDIKGSSVIYLRTFGEIDYWYDMHNKGIYKVNKYNAKELISSLGSNVSGSSYVYSAPMMVSETVFFSNYKKAFFKINGSQITKIKDDATMFAISHMYDNMWVSSIKNGNIYEYKLIEFTDIETATYEVRDTHTIDVGKSVSEYAYTPYVVFNHNDKLIMSFYSYQFNSYISTVPGQKISARINKLTKTFDFTGIDDDSILEYEDETYNMQFKFSDQKHYVNGRTVNGYHPYVTKPLSLPKNGIYEGYETKYNCDAAGYVKIDFKIANIIDSKSNFFIKCWNNGTINGTALISGKVEIEGNHVLKDTDIAKRSITQLTKESVIIPNDVQVSGYINLKYGQSIYVKKEYIQNKMLIAAMPGSFYNAKQTGKLIPRQIVVSENTDMEIYAERDFSINASELYTINEEKDFNVFVSMSDTKRAVSQNQFNLSVNEVATIHDKQGSKYNLLFSEWAANNESFEVTPAINFRGDMALAALSDKRASEGTKSLFLTAEYTKKKYIEFDTLSDKISFKYFPHTYKYSSEFYLYINGILKENITDYSYDKWEYKEYLLDPNKVSTIRFEYNKSYDVQPDRDNGFYIDEINCNVLKSTNKATIYFKSFDFGMNVGTQGVNLLFNGLETSSNITQANFYSIDNGVSWLPLEGSLPNKDNILIKSEFTKATVEEEAYIRFDSVTVMPGEFEVTTYADTHRKTYSTNPIETVAIVNHTIESVGDRYNLLFKDGGFIVEDFEGEEFKIPHKNNAIITSNAKFEVSNKKCHSGIKSYKMTYVDESIYATKPTITYKAISSKIGFWYATNFDRWMYLNVYVDGIRKVQIDSNKVSEFKYEEIALDDTKESTILFELEKQYSGIYSLSSVYLDDISFGTLLPKDYSYTESEPVDLSLFPNPIKCNIQVNDLQSTSPLTQTYFYSVDNGEWIEFIDTLPNVANVRIKTVFTKASVEEVVTASFKSISIVQDTSGPKPITLKLDLKRQVIASFNIASDSLRRLAANINKSYDSKRTINKSMSISSDSKREVVNSASRTYDTKRIAVNKQIIRSDAKRSTYKQYISYFDTIRRLSLTDALSLNLDTKRIVIQKDNIAYDAHRKVIKSINSLYDLNRKVIKDKELILPTKRIVVHNNDISYDAYREVIKSLENRYDLNRRVIKDKLLRLDTRRYVVTTFDIDKNFDTLRMVKAYYDMNRTLDTLRKVYEGESPYEIQVELNLSYSNGRLKIDSQKI